MRSKKFWLASFIAAVVLLRLASTAIGGTTAQFNNLEVSDGNTIGVATFESVLSLSPGTDNAFRHDRHPKSQLIAQTDAQEVIILLDYGETKGNRTYEKNDVIRIENISADPLEVTVEVSGDAAQFFTEVELKTGGEKGNPLTLDSGEEAGLKTTIKIPEHASPGDYEGAIIISAHNGFFEHRIPVLITVCYRE